MGVKDLSTPCIRDSPTAKNAKLGDVIKNSTSPVIIGFDISVVIIKLMKSNPTIISRYHCDPMVPLQELTDKVVDTIGSYFKHGMAKGVVVFDGLTNKLKKEKAHKERYQNNANDLLELEDLYNITEFDSHESEKRVMLRVRQLRSTLSPIRQDMMYDIKVKLEEVFQDKIVCIGAPYEADHQLAYLHRHGIVDYVVTIDSDLICLGADVIIDMNTSTGECWIMTLDELLQERLPKEFNTDGVVWTRELLCQVACFLGNDYIKRIPGNGKTKVKNFVEAISDCGNDSEMYEHILENVMVPTSGSTDAKQTWLLNTNKTELLKLWKCANAMFHHGPVFLVQSHDASIPVRDALFQDTCSIQLGSLCSEKIYSRSNVPCILGFDPFVDLVDKLDFAVFNVEVQQADGTTQKLNDSDASLSSDSSSTSNIISYRLQDDLNTQEYQVQEMYARQHLNVPNFGEEGSFSSFNSKTSEFHVSSIDLEQDSEIEWHIDVESTSIPIKIFMRQCFTLQRWSKDGQLLKSLQPPNDEDGNELYFGSIVNFDHIPVCFHSLDILSFYLDSRQVKCPSKAEDVRKVVSEIWTKQHNRLKPIPRILMRGASGWITEEVLTKRGGVENIRWSYKDDLLMVLEHSFPTFDERTFTSMFGKRNGSRLRILKHIQGGSFDLCSIKATVDMVHKSHSSTRFLTIEGACAPSQKLKEDGKNAFHNQRIVIELDREDNFVRFLDHPCSSCGCPNGCIVCAHQGGLRVICHAIKIFMEVNSRESINDTFTLFDEIQQKFPQSVHELVRNAIPTDYAFPPPDSEKKIQENLARRRISNQGKKKAGTKKNNNRRSNKGKKRKGTMKKNKGCKNTQDFSDILEGDLVERAEFEMDEEVNDEIADMREFFDDMENSAIPGMIDNSITPPIDVIGIISKWVRALHMGQDDKGRELKNVESVDDFVTAIAEHKNSDQYLATQCKFLDRLEECLVKAKTRNDERRTRDGIASNMDDTEKDSILLDVLLAIKPGRHSKKSELEGKFRDDELILNVKVPHQVN